VEISASSIPAIRHTVTFLYAALSRDSRLICINQHGSANSDIPGSTG